MAGSRVPTISRRPVAALGVFALLGVIALVTRPASAVVFSNLAGITVPDGPGNGTVVATAANPYPSNINVSGLGTSVTDVNMTLCGFSATFPSDVDVLLVSPSGATAVIMSDAGGDGENDQPISNITFTLDDQAPSLLPFDSPISAGSWRPGDDDNEAFAALDGFPPPAPAPSGNVTLAAFNGTDPNGTWSLYVMDDFDSAAAEEPQQPTFSCGWSLDILTANDPPADFDGDGDTDVSVFRPSNSFWFVNNGTTANFGTTGDIPVPADYDGDGDDDIAVFRPSNGLWLVQGGVTTAWGTAGDIPVPGDYDGDGDTDIAVFRPSNGLWFVQGGVTTAWGTSGDIPAPGDYDGDGDTDIAVFRPSAGVWFVQGGVTTAWGTAGDIPVPGDYDGDGDTDIAVFRPSAGLWFVQGGVATAWGTSGDIPVPGDYDGDGDTDVAVFRPSAAVWFVQGGTPTAWGTIGDVPLPLPDAIRRFFFPPL